MVQNPGNPYDIRFGPQGEHIVPPHLFSHSEYLEMAEFLDNTPCTTLCTVLQEGHYSPGPVRNTILRDLEYFKIRYENYIPSEPDINVIEQELSNIADNADRALHRAIVLYESLHEVLSLINTEVEPAVLWRIQKGI